MATKPTKLTLVRVESLASGAIAEAKPEAVEALEEFLDKGDEAMSRLLTDAERNRFATWLEQEAMQGDAMAKQMEGMNMPKELITRERNEALAAKIIANKLRSTESVSVG